MWVGEVSVPRSTGTPPPLKPTFNALNDLLIQSRRPCQNRMSIKLELGVLIPSSNQNNHFFKFRGDVGTTDIVPKVLGACHHFRAAEPAR